MNPEYEKIINMTNDEAADTISKLLVTIPNGRANGKSTERLRMDMALSKAIDALRKCNYTPLKKED